MTEPTPFLAVDGEAVGNDYVLLAYSDGRVGRTLTNLERGGLGTRQCLEFLLGIPKPAIPVCFGLGYDVNNWLRDVPKPTLRKLWENKVCYWRSYRIEWVPGRWFTVKHLDGRRTRVNEVFGFFQSSFIKALEAWDIGASAELERMKAARGTFERSEIKDVTDYCISECDLLVALMDNLREACREANIMPRQWIGVGAIASALLNRQGMDAHHAYDLDLVSNEHVADDVVLGAYYAGRIELIRQGVFSRIKTVDIRSAYPAAALNLPSLDGAKLVHRKRFDPCRHGVWRVRWDLSGVSSSPGVGPVERGEGVNWDPLLAPFPCRRKQAIYWPAAGTGWYHAVEVEAALAAGYPVEVLEGYVLKSRVVGEAARPFNWIKPLFAERSRLKAEGNPAEKVVKLGLNSVYGKLAQGYGFKGRPRWQNYFWAGYITAATRAKVLAAAARSKGVVMIATDGIFCQRPGVRPSKFLGGWELGGVDRLFAAQAGVYQGVTPDQEILKSRGFFAAEVDYDQLREGFELEGADYVHHYDSKRFIGLGVALMRKDFSVWRTWRTERRSLLLHPERKGLGADGVLTPHPGPLDSEPYRPKQALIEGRSLDQLQGMDQPLREMM